MTLYRDARPAAIADAGRAFAQGRGIKQLAQIEALQKRLRDVMVPFIEKRPDISASEARSLAALVLRQSDTVASGKFDAAALDKLTSSTRDHQRSQHTSNAELTDRLARTNAHLKDHEPALHRAIGPTAGVPGLGSHPQIVGRLLAEQRQRDWAHERASTRSTWLRSARGRAAAEAVPRAGILGEKK